MLIKTSLPDTLWLVLRLTYQVKDCMPVQKAFCWVLFGETVCSPSWLWIGYVVKDGIKSWPSQTHAHILWVLVLQVHQTQLSFESWQSQNALQRGCLKLPHLWEPLPPNAHCPLIWQTYKGNIVVEGAAQLVGSLSTMIVVLGLIPSTEYYQVRQHTSVIPTLEKWRQKD